MIAFAAFIWLLVSAALAVAWWLWDAWRESAEEVMPNLVCDANLSGPEPGVPHTATWVAHPSPREELTNPNWPITAPWLRQFQRFMRGEIT